MAQKNKWLWAETYFSASTSASHSARASSDRSTWRGRRRRSSLWHWNYCSSHNWSIIKWRSSYNAKLRFNHICVIPTFFDSSVGGTMKRKSISSLSTPGKVSYILINLLSLIQGELYKELTGAGRLSEFRTATIVYEVADALKVFFVYRQILILV